MEYVEIDAARKLGGLRLVLTAGVPGPWGEAAKGLFKVKGVPFVPVRQVPMLSDAALLEWTGQTSAPVAIYENERARSTWTDILHLAERLGPEPALIPGDASARARMFGLAHEICGELGLGWSRRLMMVADGGSGGGGDDVSTHIGRKYGFEVDAAKHAPARVVEVLELMSRVWAEQRERGSRFLLGNALTALDIYWAAFAALLDPLGNELCPMPAGLRAVYENRDPAVAAAVDPALLEHRDFIYAEHLGLPIDL